MDTFMNVQELRSYLGIGRNAAYDLVKTEGFPAISFGKTIKVSVKGLEDWIDKNMGNKIELNHSSRA